MSILLEIGAGSSPATELPGSVLQDPESSYCAVDAWAEKTEKHCYDDEAKTRYLASLAITNGAELPFSDQSIGHVIMKNVFGEYTMMPEHTGSSFQNTATTLYEAFRVLKDGAQIAIAEENTPKRPATVDNISTVLLDAGFDDIRVYTCESMENPYWLGERTKYWDIDSDKYRSGEPGAWRDIAYLIKGTRPPAETETFTKPISLPDKWRANNLRGWGHPDNEEWVKEAVFQKSTRVIERAVYDPEHPYEQHRPITVITKDGELDLATYFEKVRTREIAPLFCD